MTLSAGDAAGANVGWSVRDFGADNIGGGTLGNVDTDLFTIRVHKTGSSLRLQQGVNGVTPVDIINFNTTSLSNLAVRAVFDLDNNTLNTFYKLGSDAEVSVSSTAFTSTLQWDSLRLFANTNNVDWGATDTALMDFYRVSAIPEPSTYSVLAGFGTLSLAAFRRRKA